MKLTKPQQKMLTNFGAFSFFWDDPGVRGKCPSKADRGPERGPVLRRLLAKGAVVQDGQHNLGPRYRVTPIGQSALARAQQAAS